MSRAFNDTSNRNGLVQAYEKEIGVDLGHVSGNTNRLKDFASDTRSAWDIYTDLAIRASGRWQFDDSNHTGDAVYKTNLVSGTAEYPLTTDDTDSALILDVHRIAVLLSATDTVYHDIYPVDEQSQTYPGSLLSEEGDTGAPLYYDKTGNVITLDPTPDYNATNGLKVYISREASYFVDTDTTKKPGCPGIHHDYFYLRPAYEHARRNNLATLPMLEREILKWEGDAQRGIIGKIERYFAERERDVRKIMKGKPIKYI